MMTGAAQELMQGTDTSWVDDDLKNGDGQVDNWASIGGTSLSLNGSLLTDAVWTSRPYNGPKAWIIDVGTISTSPITNIDLSAMKGYDLRLITGEYVGGKFVGDDSGLNTTSAIIHLAPDPNRVHTDGNKKYFFCPDYWVPSTTFNTPSYFRRMPTITPIVDSKGYNKVWVDMANPLMDVFALFSSMWIHFQVRSMCAYLFSAYAPFSYYSPLLDYVVICVYFCIGLRTVNRI
jgi:hypothetical protein